MKKCLFTVLAGVVLIGTRAQAQQPAAERLNAIFDTGTHKVYVAAHRGDWRDAPENSLRSLSWAAKLGVDIVEMDLKRTHDNHLVVMHDVTLDRTTTGSGLVSNYDFDKLEALHLRSGTGHPTSYRIPSFSEELAAAKENNVILDVDQGWDYFNDVLREVRVNHMVGQVILNVFPNVPYQEFQRRQGDVPEEAALMIVVNMNRADAESIIESYKQHKRTIVQCIFDEEYLPFVPQIHRYRQASPVWINSLWPEQNAGHDDERAVEEGQPDPSWGWLITSGAKILQTDRPREMMGYLLQKNLR